MVELGRGERGSLSRPARNDLLDIIMAGWYSHRRANKLGFDITLFTGPIRIGLREGREGVA